MCLWLQFTWYLQNWNITLARLTFLAVLTIYKRQRGDALWTRCDLLLHSGSSTQLLVLILIYVSFQRLPHFHEVHFKDSWESNHGEGCQSLSLLWGWCLFMHGLLVMPVAVCLVNDYIKFILFVACLVVLLHHHSWTLLSDVLPMRRSHCGASSP